MIPSEKMGLGQEAQKSVAEEIQKTSSNIMSLPTANEHAGASLFMPAGAKAVIPQIVHEYFAQRGYDYDWFVQHGGRLEIRTVSVEVSKVKGEARCVWEACPHLFFSENRARLLPSKEQIKAWYSMAEEAKSPNKAPQRYWQPRGSSTKAYWVGEQQPNTPVLLIEGESNVLTVHKLAPKLTGLWVIGQPGASAYRNSNLDNVSWNKQIIYACPDRDDAAADDGLSNGVRAGWLGTANYYASRGATVKVLLLQNTALGQNYAGKLAIDEYLIKGGTLEALLQTACDLTDWDPLHAIKRDYALHTPSTNIAHRRNPNLIYSKDKFATLTDNLGTIMVGGKPLSISQAFIRDPKRPEFDRRDWVLDAEVGDIQNGTLNTWSGIAASRWSGEGDAQAWKDFKTHTLAMSEGIESARDLNLMWMAQMLRHPTVKPSWGWFIYSLLQGVGKTALSRILAHIIGDTHAKVTEDSKIFKGEFVGKELMNLLFFSANDINTGNREALRTLYYSIITDPSLSVNDKGISRFEIVSYIRLFASANRPDMRITAEDRRFHVTGVVLPMEKDEYVKWFHKALLPAVLGNRHMLLGIYNGLMDEYGEASDKFDFSLAPPKYSSHALFCEDSASTGEGLAREITQRVLDYMKGGGNVAFTKPLIMDILQRDGGSRDALNGYKAFRNAVAYQNGGSLPQKVVTIDKKQFRLSVAGANVTYDQEQDANGDVRQNCSNDAALVKKWFDETNNLLLGEEKN